MKYSFSDMLNADIYESTRVMFVFGKYIWFNNMVCDTLKTFCINENQAEIQSLGLDDEFNIASTEDDDIITSSVDFNTFFDVIGVANINGKWFCKAELSMLNKRQIEKVTKYMKDPSDNGILVIVASEWKEYKDFLKNRILSFSRVSHMITLSFPNKKVLNSIVGQTFNERGIELDANAIEYFITRMGREYEQYEDVISEIVEKHTTSYLSLKDMKSYMKNIEYFVIDDFIYQLLSPLSSDKTNNKKVLRILSALQEQLGAKNLVYSLLKTIDEYIEFRILINKGVIPIGIEYFFSDIMYTLGKGNKYEKMNEWMFRRKAQVASMTSLTDWEYMKMILASSIRNIRLPDKILEERCTKALYELATRSILTTDRLNNIIGADNIISKQFNNINRIQYNESALAKIKNDIHMSEIS